MKRVFLLILLSIHFVSCKKEKEAPVFIKEPRNFSIEKGRSIRTLVEVQFPSSSSYSYYYSAEASATTGEGIVFFQDGLLYSTTPGVTYINAIKVLPNSDGMTPIYTSVNSSNLVSRFIKGLNPNTTYYIKGYRVIVSTGEVIISDNEIEMTTTDEIIYNNLTLTANKTEHRIGTVDYFSLDYYSKVAGGVLGLSNYEDMLLSSIEVYVDNTLCKNTPTIYSDLYNITYMDGNTINYKKGESSYNDFVNYPMVQVKNFESINLNIPCSFASGSHDIKIKFDGYLSSVNTTQQDPYSYGSTNVSLSKNTAIYDDYIYLNGLDSIDAVQSHGILYNYFTLPLVYDSFSRKYVFKVPSYGKGNMEIRLFNSCDNPLIGNLNIK